MLAIAPIKPVPGDLPRKWMTDDYFDLYVWYQPDGQIHGFQLCYDKEQDQRALTWMHTGTFTHHRIDAGDQEVEANRSPILTVACPFNSEPLRTEFMERAVRIEAEIRELVLAKLDEFSASGGAVRHSGL